MQFMTTKPAPQKILKGILYTEDEDIVMQVWE
jgi:hypothetical protein